jgi:hypothetical protein
MSHEQLADAGMSVEAWAALPDDAPGELVDGHLVEEEIADAAHETVVLFLAVLFRVWLAGEGFVLPSG